MNNEADALRLKQAVSIESVLTRYGVELKNNSFALCPFHSENTPSFRVYKQDNNFHCFGCGAHGDAIDFVRMLFRLSFRQALLKIDTDFALGLFNKVSSSEFCRSSFLQRAALAKRTREKQKRDWAEENYWKAFDQCKKLEENRERFRPKSSEEELHPLFVESLVELEHQKYVLEYWEEERLK